MGAEARLKSMFDGGDLDRHRAARRAPDPLKFRDEKRYADRLKEARTKTGLNDAIKVGLGKLGGLPVVIARAGLRLHGRLARHGGGRGDRHRPRHARSQKRTPFILFAASGGARMQEGILSLMQMPRTTVAVQTPARGEAALYRGAHQSDHRRRHRLLRDAGRRPHRRARRR